MHAEHPAGWLAGNPVFSFGCTFFSAVFFFYLFGREILYTHVVVGIHGSNPAAPGTRKCGPNAEFKLHMYDDCFCREEGKGGAYNYVHS